ncbi:MAG: pilus assembly protein [Chloroflexi bacterium]|nr:pilus assembly protein [Chloroflexota bacterium]
MRRRSRFRGQSLIELVLLFSTLLIIFSGLVEFGFWMLEYSNMVVAARNAARFAVDDDYQLIELACTPSPSASCFVGTPRPCDTDFYCKTATIAENTLAQNKPAITLDPASDDIVVSAFTFTQGLGVTARHPNATGWSRYGNHTSRFSNAEIANLLASQGVTNTSSGYVLVEIFYNYHHTLGLPWITAFVPNPLLLHVYTFMPLYSAAPTPTP